MQTASSPLWGPALDVILPEGQSQIVLICEHASNHIPPALGDLGLDESALQEHIAWDIGGADLAKCMSEALNAPLVTANFSRLVYDCNRPPHDETAMPAKSERFIIPGNQALSEPAKQARITHIYEPFHAGLAALLAPRMSNLIKPVLVSIHTFTANYAGTMRDAEIGLLFGDDTRLADAMLAQARRDEDLRVAPNTPYAPADGVFHTMEKHALPHGLLHIMIEVRNDLLRSPDRVGSVSEQLVTMLLDALNELEGQTAKASSTLRHAS